MKGFNYFKKYEGTMEIKVNEPTAEFFYEQCTGHYAGHMANIPNNPVLYGLCLAHRIVTKEDFVRFLRGVVEQLEKAQPF